MTSLCTSCSFDKKYCANQLCLLTVDAAFCPRPKAAVPVVAKEKDRMRISDFFPPAKKAIVQGGVIVKVK